MRLLAQEYFDQLADLRPDTFDLLGGNVLVSSHQFREEWLSQEKKARIRSAMDILTQGP